MQTRPSTHSSLEPRRQLARHDSAIDLRNHAEDHIDAGTTTEQLSEGNSTAPPVSERFGGFQIYDDSLPASSQPQTPQNLPESRHRSRLAGAFTAPVTRIGSRFHGTHRLTGQWGNRRTPSPEGVETPGFRGLYGGLENTDDIALFEHAQRLMGDADGREMFRSEEEQDSAEGGSSHRN